jgi:hypothetical protein
MLCGAPEGVLAPPSRAALAAMLVQAAEGEPLLANRPVDPWNHPLQRVDLRNGWVLEFLWSSGGLEQLCAATAPDGAHWSVGCDRWPDWGAGPDAVALEPLQHLITPEQREKLRQRLLTCSCWPAPEPLPVPPPPTREQLDALWPIEEMAS